MNSINIICAPNSTSYGRCSTNIIKELSKTHNVSLFPISDNPQSIEVFPEDQDVIQKALNNHIFFDYNTPSVKMWHQDWQHYLFPGKGLRYQYPIFELDKFSNHGKHCLESVYGIIVPSKWAAQVVKNNGINVPTFVVPLGVGKLPRKVERKDNITKFVMAGKWEVRKRQIELIECFERAFTEDDNVELHLICANRLLPLNEQTKWKSIADYSSLASKIKVYDWIPDDNEVYKIFSECDCGVYLNAAEGFNLPLMECLGVGLPVIALNYSAPTEFLSPANAMLIEPTDFSVAWDGCWFTEQSNPNNGLWAVLSEANKEQCVEYMRNVHKRRQAGDDLTNYEGIKTAEKFTWKHTAEKLLEVIQ